MPVTLPSPPINSLAIHRAMAIGSKAHAPTEPIRVEIQAITKANTSRIRPRFCMTELPKLQLDDTDNKNSAMNLILAQLDRFPDKQGRVAVFAAVFTVLCEELDQDPIALASKMVTAQRMLAASGAIKRAD